MEDFKERKAEYLKELRENIDILENIKIEDGNPEEIMELLLDPKNEKELTIANMIITFFSDALDLAYNASYDDVKKIPLSENIGIKYYIDIINVLKVGQDVESIIRIDEKEAAQVLYSYLVAFASDSEDTIEFMAEKTGFDLEDEIQLKQLELYLDKANRAFNNKRDSLIGDVKVSDWLKLSKAKMFCDEFHTLCEEGKLVKNMSKNL